MVVVHGSTGDGSRDVEGYCTFCRSRCGTLNTVAGGRLVAVAPLPDHPTGRAICPKGRAAPEIVHSSRRLTTPLRRTAPKGADDPGWRAISWDEAMGEIASRLGAIREQSGPEAVAFANTSPSATPIIDAIEWIQRFVTVFGSPNTCNGTEICNWHKDHAHVFTFGCAMPLPDFARSDLIVLWGHNPAAVWLSEAGEIAEARRRGARIAVIDPRRTAHAAEADHWLRIRPGTDAALALCLSGLLIEAGRFDLDFVRGWTNGPLLVGQDGRFLREKGGAGRPLVHDLATRSVRPFDRDLSPARNGAAGFALTGEFDVGGEVGRPAFALFAERAAAYPVERTAALTGIPADAIRRFASALADSPSVSYYAWTGIGQGTNATATDRAVATLYGLTGCFDAPGGNVVAASHPVRPINDPDLLPAGQRAKALGAAARPLGPAAEGAVTARELYEAILTGQPYRVRALMTFGANLLVSRADVAMGRAALAALEFNVHCDLFETPTGRLADILLPVSGPFEREAIKVGFDITPAAREHIQLRPAMVPPVGESRQDADIVCELARRLGLDDLVLTGGVEAGWRFMLEPIGLTPDDLRRSPGGVRRPLDHATRRFAQEVDGRVRGFATETGRVELYSETLLRSGYDPLPSAEILTADAQFPLILLSSKSAVYCHSQHRHVASLRRRAREPVASISPAAAAARGVGEGDWIVIETRAGEARFRARLDPALADDVVAAEFGWWEGSADLGLPAYDPLAPGGSSFNRLVDSDDVDPVSGSVPLKRVACEVRRVASSVPSRWTGWRSLAVTRVERLGEHVTVLDLAAPEGGRLPTFRPGEHLRLRLDVPGAGRVERAYTLCGPASPTGPALYRVAIRTTDGGAMSTHCRSGLMAGDRVDAAAPSGSFLLPVRADFPVVLITAGIGITPVLAYLEALQGEPDPPEIVVHVGHRDAQSDVFAGRLAGLAAAIPGMRLVTHHSRPGSRAATARPGRLSADAVESDLIRRRARFYLCGPPAMIRDVTAGLVRLGVPGTEIFKEVFRSPSGAPDAGSGPFRVRFARSEVDVLWRSGDGTLLSLAEAAGLTPPSGCRVGSCESCTATILQGQVAHADGPDDRDETTCMTCQAVPASDLVLDL